MKLYHAVNDGYGIVGYGFTCQSCRKEHNFVDTENTIQVCSHCQSNNQMIPYDEDTMDFFSEYIHLDESDTK